MRRTLTTLHRWFGLFTAIFLFIAGFTGAIISWDHELDEALNPELFEASTPAAPIEPARALALADEVERNDPKVRVQYLPLTTEAGHTLGMFLAPRVNAETDALYEVDYNQVALDPSTGEVQGRRMWGEISLSRQNLLPFLYKLHYTMHLPDGFGIEWGMLFMGIVGIVWTLDCFISLWISFPNRKVWRKSLAFRWKQGSSRLNFDLHRSGGVWVWLLLLTLAVTSVSMNLGDEIVRPVVARISTLTPSPFDEIEHAPENRPHIPAITRGQAIELARSEAHRRGWSAPAGGVFYDADHGIYGVGFFEADNSHGDGGLGNPWLYFHGRDGSYAGHDVPGSGSAGDIFLQAQFPLHSGRLFGLAGRVVVSMLGAVVAMLSVTGIVIWSRRRRTRSLASVLASEPSSAPVHVNPSTSS